MTEENNKQEFVSAQQQTVDVSQHDSANQVRNQAGHGSSGQPVPPSASVYTQPQGTPSGYSQQYGPGHAAYAAPGVPMVAVPQPRKSYGWIVAIVVVLAVAIVLLGGMVSCSNAMSASFGSLSGMTSSSAPLTSGDTIGIINIDGTIQYDGTTSSPEGLKAQLDKAAANPDIKAVVLRVNSGGGTATAGEEMAIYVRDFGKPIVVSSASMNASAAYEISSQADYIFTAETTAIGSIGTVMSMTDISGLLEKLGIKVDNIASADSKDSTYGDRPLTEEEREYYQKMVDQINDTFIAKVAAGRTAAGVPMTVEDVRKLATGLTFTGIDAVENGLADEIGTLEDAVSKAAELAGISRYNTCYLRPESSELSQLLTLLSESNSTDLPALGLKELDGDVKF